MQRAPPRCSCGRDYRRQLSVPESLGEVRQPGAVGFNEEEDGPAVLGQDRGWLGDGDKRANAVAEGAQGLHLG